MEANPWSIWNFTSILDLVVWAIMLALFLLYFWALTVSDASDTLRMPERAIPMEPRILVPDAAPGADTAAALV